MTSEAQADVVPEALRRLSPKALREAGTAELDALAVAARQLVVDSTARNGGHLGPNLGVVELTFALHRVFDSPHDILLWDTGHQSYIHKMVTGRAEGFPALRTRDGLAGYPSRAESDHDWVENSHAGTSLSYAAGLAAGFGAGSGRQVVAVIGDGALTAGMAMEALNDIAERQLDVVVVLNDNGRSYAPTTGAVALALAELRGRGRTYDADWHGLRYVGPVDGHDVPALEAALTRARDHRGPVVVHVVTRKGLGYPPAENDPVDHLHGVAPFDPATGAPPPTAGDRVAAGAVLSDTLCRAAAEDERIVVVAAAMTSASGLDPFARAFPDRIVDVGIAEQHAVTYAAGLAMTGRRPVVVIHSTFLGRAFDQLMFDVGLHRLPVVVVSDRAGITGGDGPSHHGLLDIALFRHVPGAVIGEPSDTGTFTAMLREALDGSGPVLLRHNRALPRAESGPRPVGRWSWDGSDDADVLLITAGPLDALGPDVGRRLAAHGHRTGRARAHWIRPVDPALAERAARHRLVVTLEDHFADGGLGSEVLEHLSAEGCPTPVLRLGVPHGYLTHGQVPVLHRETGLDAEGVTHSVLGALERG
ncbi:1-deoxy-D-xylulose-5-phosphate synthase [Streptomyces sp. NPDC049687]|uniref:1-deoxy-D-xylulose-5-phosphate synthase n=1 Tax=Streptomyces sp. NPDC049687 TaxID=3365596 RepID=UPI00378C9018